MYYKIEKSETSAQVSFVLCLGETEGQTNVLNYFTILYRKKVHMSACINAIRVIPTDHAC